MAVIDANCAGDHADAEEEQDLLKHVQVVGDRDIPDHPENHAELEREPDQRDQPIPKEIFLAGLKIGVFQVQPGRGIQHGEQPPGRERHQDEPPAALIGDKDDQRDQAQR